jgi:exodeoxyribonuclease-3
LTKITTWNVNGIRSALNKGAWDWVRKFNPDVLCFQEVRAYPDQLVSLHHELFIGYNLYWHPAERAGYSGVLTMTLKSPENYQIGLGIPRYDCEGRVIFIRYDDYLIFNIYFPSGQRGQERVAFKLEFYASLLKLLDEFHARSENLIITGDFNTAHREIDLRYPKANQKTSGFLPEEREWIDRYLARGFVDAYRALYPERVQYTWWTYRLNARSRNIGWRLDYFLVSEALMPRIQDVIIHDEITGSDHCPVTLYIDDPIGIY